jgi:glycosyltransferase involved in cell wall biosynthesis
VIALLHGAPGDGAVERYVDQIARAVGGEGVRVEARDEASVPELVRILRRLRPRVAHVMDVWPQAVVAARLARVPRVLVTHHTPELPRRDNLAGRAWQRLGWLMRPEVIYTSEADRARDGRRPSHVVPLGIDLERFESPRPALEVDGPLVGNVARLAPQKDHRTLIEAARLVPEAEFAIVGAGELREELERQAEGLRVRFTGARDDVPELLASFDVFAFPSRFEGLCLAVIEAQAAGVPVVATPVGGIRETVVDGETGLLVPTGDAAALAAGIRRLLEDRPAAEAMAAEAKRRVRERYSIERMVAETLRLYGLPR